MIEQLAADCSLLRRVLSPSSFRTQVATSANPSGYSCEDFFWLGLIFLKRELSGSLVTTICSLRGKYSIASEEAETTQQLSLPSELGDWYLKS